MKTEEGILPGQAQEMPNEPSAIRRAEQMSRKDGNVGAIAFKRTGDPAPGEYVDAVILKSFGEVPTRGGVTCVNVH